MTITAQAQKASNVSHVGCLDAEEQIIDAVGIIDKKSS